MPKKLIKRYIPTPEKIKSLKGLGFLGSWLHSPSIWHLHRHSVAKAFLIGLFWMAIPVPSQMLFAAICAILFKANLPLSVILVWISNPFTMGPIFYFNYVIGTNLLGQEANEEISFELNWEWMINVLGDLWLPLYLGSVVVGITLGVASFIMILLLWRQQVVKNWKLRQERRQKNRANR